MTDDSRQRSEDRERKTENRRRMTEGGELNEELGMRKPVTRGQKTNLFVENRVSIVKRTATRDLKTDHGF